VHFEVDQRNIGVTFWVLLINVRNFFLRIILSAGYPQGRAKRRRQNRAAARISVRSPLHVSPRNRKVKGVLSDSPLSMKNLEELPPAPKRPRNRRVSEYSRFGCMALSPACRSTTCLQLWTLRIHHPRENNCCSSAGFSSMEFSSKMHRIIQNPSRIYDGGHYFPAGIIECNLIRNIWTGELRLRKLKRQRHAQ
jgi:hypothetical protein